jgi:prepilin-type N-terminal cleavage/methylation domain-containing protein
MESRAVEKGFTLIELLITLTIIAVLVAIVLPMYKDALLRAHVSAGATDAHALQLAFKRYHVDHSAYPDNGPFDLATFEPLVALGYYDGAVGSRILDDQADGYDAPDDSGPNQEFWLEFTLAYDPTVRFLVADSDNAPLGGGGTHYDGIYLFKGGALTPL